MCRRLLEQVLGCGGLLVTAGLQDEQVVTWFQFHSYLQRQSISDLEKHLTQLTKEGRAWWRGNLEASYSIPCPTLAWATTRELL